MNIIYDRSKLIIDAKEKLVRPVKKHFYEPTPVSVVEDWEYVPFLENDGEPLSIMCSTSF